MPSHSFLGRLFRSRDGRLRAGWRVALFLVALLFVQAVVAGVTVLVLAYVFGAETVQVAHLSIVGGVPWEVLAELPRPLPYSLLLAAAVALPFTGALVWTFRRWLDQRSWRSLGFRRRPGLGPELGLGLVLGTVVIALTLVPLVLAGAVDGVGPGWGEGPAGLWPADVAVVLALLVAAALFEELVFRAYILSNLQEATGSVVGVLISAILFAALHAGNPGFGIVSLLNIFLAGVLMGTAFVLTGRLWLPWALHVAWNAVMGMLLGLPVSGLSLPSLFRLRLAGSPLVTGGSFGLEASLWNTTAQVFVIVVVVCFGLRVLALGSPGGTGGRPPSAQAAPDTLTGSAVRPNCSGEEGK